MACCPAVRLRYALPVLLLGGLVAHPGAAAAQTAGCGQPVTPGVSNRTIVVGGTQRSYLLVVPRTVAAATPNPVIIGLHGGSDTAQNASRYMGLTSEDPALFVYPQAPYWPEAGGVAWNVDPQGVDFPYFDALIAELGREHCVDTTRVFAAGKSNGGFMVNSLACFRPGVFRAIAPVAGGGPQTTRCPEGVAAMIVHGSADRVVPISSGRFSRDHWLARNGNTGAPPVPADPPPCVGYPGSSRPVLWCEHGGGHDWPTWAGAAIRGFFLSRFGSGAPTQPPPGAPPSPGGGTRGVTGPSSPSIAISRLSITRGRVRATVTCGAARHCAGRLTFRTVARRRPLGTARFSLAPGQRRTLRVRVARSVLRRGRRLRVTATVSAGDLRATRTQTLAVRRPQAAATGSRSSIA